MKTVALATYSKLPQLNEDDRLILPQLERLGVRYEIVSWHDHRADWSRCETVVLRSVWDYYVRFADFKEWIAGLEARGTRLYNSADVVRWNWNKRYLIELESRGVPTVPTLWVATPEELSAVEWEEVVLKPSVSAGAYKTYRLKRAEIAAKLPELGKMSAEAPYMAQPFLKQIQTEGEYSFLFFNGQFSHSLLKKPASGDFRVQHTHGGTILPHVPSPKEQGEAAAALNACERETLYARVDMVRGDDGRMLLVELELIEPHLYLGFGDGAAERFARALAERLQ